MSEGSVVIHQIRPGPIRGTMVLCETRQVKGQAVAELSKRGLAQVDCPDCLSVIAGLRKLLLD